MRLFDSTRFPGHGPSGLLGDRCACKGWAIEGARVGTSEVIGVSGFGEGTESGMAKAQTQGRPYLRG
jgi:hypothetical protein